MNVIIFIFIVMLFPFLLNNYFGRNDYLNINVYHKSINLFYNKLTDIHRFRFNFNVLRAVLFGFNIRVTHFYFEIELNFFIFNLRLTVIYNMEPLLVDIKEGYTE